MGKALGITRIAVAARSRSERMARASRITLVTTATIAA
jgi:hypothetical protein